MFVRTYFVRRLGFAYVGRHKVSTGRYGDTTCRRNFFEVVLPPTRFRLKESTSDPKNEQQKFLFWRILYKMYTWTIYILYIKRRLARFATVVKKSTRHSSCRHDISSHDRSRFICDTIDGGMSHSVRSFLAKVCCTYVQSTRIATCTWSMLVYVKHAGSSRKKDSVY